MKPVAAIGFDLFNTLITVAPQTIEEAGARLTDSLLDSGISIERAAFQQAHREWAVEFLKQSRRDGKETHNRFWISRALASQGHRVHPGDPRIAAAVDAYFSAFLDFSQALPGTKEMLTNLKRHYPLGLLSNFTHAPAAWKLIETTGLASFFDTVLISGDLGYRKPHPVAFNRLVEALGVEKHRILFVGDDPDSDIEGAGTAGLQPVWHTVVRDQKIPHAKGVATVVQAVCDDEVPRISSWKDLLHLLAVA
jgi:HAD superfamily hydrolase (TIGR01549 family)